MSLGKQHFPICVLLLLMTLIVTSGSSRCVLAQSQQDESKSTAPSTGTITGRVINENGQPLSHVTIYVTAPITSLQQRTATTDDGGNFQLTDLDALVYFVGASAPSYINFPREPDSPLPTSYRIGDSVTINLIKGGVITGTVTSPGGEPMVQAGVRAILIRDATGKPPSSPRFPLERLTDDRGVYRIYGLATGTYLVSAGGRGPYGYATNAYDSDSPTYAPSSTRDAAAEISVRAGEETSGVDIRYRGEAGHAISGTVSGPTTPDSGTDIKLMQMMSGAAQMVGFSYQSPNSKGFAIYGVADGDYDLTAQWSSGQGEVMASEPLRVTVKGGDITGINLVLKALSLISGRIVLENTTALECKNKRKPLFSETLLMVRRTDKDAKDQIPLTNFSGSQAVPDKSGDFLLRNLVPGLFSLNARFFAKYWYLRSIVREIPGALPARTGAANQQTDLARNGINLKFGERLTGVAVTLGEGAASLRGVVKLGEGERVPAKLYAHLVPSEKEHAEDVLRFFTTLVQADGTFAVNNLPPGRYWILARLSPNNEPQFDAKLRAPEETDARIQIRRAAEAAKTEVEFKPCQNVIDYQLSFKISSKQ